MPLYCVLLNVHILFTRFIYSLQIALKSYLSYTTNTKKTFIYYIQIYMFVYNIYLGILLSLILCLQVQSNKYINLLNFIISKLFLRIFYFFFVLFTGQSQFLLSGLQLITGHRIKVCRLSASLIRSY